MPTTKKFLDYNGLVKVLQELQNYPDNTILAAVINAIQDSLDEKADIADIPDINTEDYVQKTDLATQSTAGLMSANDKLILDNMNPNMTVTLSNIYEPEVHVINAKMENMVDLEIIEQPHISEQIRTINLLDINTFTPGYYIGSNGSLSTNANDKVGDFISVSPGDDIYYTGIIGPTNSSSINRRLHVYDANQTWIKQLSFAGSLKVGDHWSTHGIVPSNGAYVRVSWGVEDTNVMISIGSPAKYYPYHITPFTAITSASFQVSLDDTYEDADEYTVTVPVAAGDVYGFKYNPILGKLYVTSGHIASYNGETLPGGWVSDRDVYAEGTTPSTGAEVIYQLNDEDIEEYDITSIDIPMFYRINYIKTDTGIITSLTYYAETFGVSHITIQDAATFGDEEILEEDVTSWKHAGALIDTKADIESPVFTGQPSAPTPGTGSNTGRLATTEFVNREFGNVIAPFEGTISKASKNYAIGEYLIAQSQLYKVTATIAQNTAITPGTNVEAINMVTEFGLSSLMQILYPIGAIYQNTTNVNPSTFITGTTWTLRSSVALASEHVFGNGKTLGWTDGTQYGGTRTNANSGITTGKPIGANVGVDNYTYDTLTNTRSLGVPTKTQLGANPENSGLIADTITIYTWERTA